MDKFWELLEESVIFQGTLVIIISVTVCFMYAAGKAVPGELVALLGMIVGFFFGGKTMVAVRKAKEQPDREQPDSES